MNSVQNLLNIHFANLSAEEKLRIKELGKPLPDLKLQEKQTSRDRCQRHVKFCTDENTFIKSSREFLESVRWPMDSPDSSRIDPIRSGSPHVSAKYKDVKKDAESPMPESQATSKSEATANTDVQTSKAETIPEEELEEQTEEKENEERKHPLKIRMKPKCKTRSDDEECSNVKTKTKPRVAVKLYDGRDSWPLEISKWYLSDHGQLLLSCTVPTLTKCVESQSPQEPSETVIAKKVQNDSHCEEKREHEDEDLVTLFERSAISRSVFQTQPCYTPRDVNSETFIRTPIHSPTFIVTPSLSPPSSSMAPGTSKKLTSPPVTSDYLNTSVMAEVLPTIQMQSFTMLASQKAMFTHITSTTNTELRASSTSQGDNSCKALTTHEMIPIPVLHSTSYEDHAMTSSKIVPTTISNSLVSGSSIPTTTKTTTISTMPQIIPTGDIVKPIVEREPGLTSMRSSKMSEMNTSSTPLVKKTSRTPKDASNIKPYQFTDSESSLNLKCEKSLQEPNMIATISSVQSFSTQSPHQKNTNVSPALTITPVSPPVSTPPEAMWAPSPLKPVGNDPSLATTTQTSVSHTPQIPLIEPAKFDDDPSCLMFDDSPPCLMPLISEPCNLSKGKVTAGTANAMDVSVATYDMDGSNLCAHASLQAIENVSEEQHIALLENSQNIKSRMETTQQMLRRLTVDIQAQHARICTNSHETQVSSQNFVQPIGAPSDFADELRESNTELGSVSLIIRRNHEYSEPLTKSENACQSPEISLQNNNQPDATNTWRFWHPQSASWFDLSLPERDAHQMLQSAEPVKRNLENLLQSALNVRDPSINSDPELAEKGIFSECVNLSTDTPNEQQQKDNIECQNKRDSNAEWRLVQPQDGTQSFLNETHVTTFSSKETQGMDVQCPELANDPQMQSPSEEKVPQQSLEHESQSWSTLSVRNIPNDDEGLHVKTEVGASLGGDVLNQQLPRPVVWRLWDPNTGSWVNLNISKANPEQVNEFQNSHTQGINEEKEIGESSEAPKEISLYYSNIDENNDIQKHENILPETQSQKPEASMDESLSKIEKQAITLGKETETVPDDFDTNNNNCVKHSLTLDQQTGKESTTITNDFWSDNTTSFFESDADSLWPTSSVESVNATQIRCNKCASGHRRYKTSGSGTRPRCSTGDSQSYHRAYTNKRYALRQNGSRTFLRSQLSVRRWLQKRQKTTVNGRSDHRLQSDRWICPRPLVSSNYNSQVQHTRRCRTTPQETITIQPADDANIRSVETPSLLLLCLTADTSLLPKARYQRSGKRTYCIVQSATTNNFGNPGQLPWKRASRQWRRNVANDK